MKDKRFIFASFLGGVGIGLAVLTSPSATGGLIGFGEGLLGIRAESPQTAIEANPFKARLASPTLRKPLQSHQHDEILQGLMFLAQGNHADAAAIIGKYALLGDALAQHAIGGMYAFGQGLPIDSKESLQWLRLAADQGNRGAAELAANINANPDWERRVVAFAAANSRDERVQSGYGFTSEYQQRRSPAPQYDFSNASRTNQYASSSSRYSDNSASPVVRPSASMGALASVDEAYGSTSASRRYLDTHTAPPEPNKGSGQMSSDAPIILNRAGPKTYSNGSGDIYAQAGPHGVVNTRTGEFSPTN